MWHFSSIASCHPSAPRRRCYQYHCLVWELSYCIVQNWFTDGRGTRNLLSFLNRRHLRQEICATLKYYVIIRCMHSYVWLTFRTIHRDLGDFSCKLLWVEMLNANEVKSKSKRAVKSSTQKLVLFISNGGRFKKKRNVHQSQNVNSPQHS
jgi:hypothetical protein